MNYKPKIGDVEFPNPVWIASSPFTENYESIEKCIQKGAGGIVLKSVGVFDRKCGRICQKCRTEKRTATTWLSPYGDRMVESSSTSSRHCERLTIDESNDIVEKVKQNYPEIPVVVNFSPEKPSDFDFVDRIEGDVLEINSRYFVRKGQKKLIKYSGSLSNVIEMNYPKLLSESSERLKILNNEMKRLKKPVLMKIVPMPEAWLEDQLDMDVDGFTAIDSLKVSGHTMENGHNMKYFGGIGSVSGDPLKWHSYWTVYNIKKDKPEKFVSASGGIFSKQDVKDSMEKAGANSVQLCSALYFYGYDVIEKLVK